MHDEEISTFRAILNLLRNILLFVLFMVALLTWMTWDENSEHFRNIKTLSIQGEEFKCQIVDVREWRPSSTKRRVKRQSTMYPVYYGTFLCDNLYAGIDKPGYPQNIGDTIYVLLDPKGSSGCLINTKKKPFHELLIENWDNKSCDRVTPQKELEIRNQFSK